MSYPKLPWKGITEFIMRLEPAASRHELVSTALSVVGDLIPNDATTLLMDYWGNIIGSYGFPDSDVRLFSEHYWKIVPIWLDGRVGVILPSLVDLNRIYWDEFDDSEFVSDYARPRGWAKAICQFTPEAGQRSALYIQRGRSGHDFTDAEVATLRVASVHLDNFLAIHEKLSARESGRITVDSVKDALPSLTRREAEVARLSVLGLSAPEIGTKLFISERTVEAHVAHIYDKIGIRSKRELRERIAGGSRAS